MGIIIYDDKRNIIKKIVCGIKEENIPEIHSSCLSEFFFVLETFNYYAVSIPKELIKRHGIEEDFILSQSKTAAVIFTYGWSGKKLINVELHYIQEYQMMKGKKETDMVLKMIKAFQLLSKESCVKIFAYSLKNIDKGNGFSSYTKTEAKLLRSGKRKAGCLGGEGGGSCKEKKLSRKQLIVFEELLKKEEGLTVEQIKTLIYGGAGKRGYGNIYNIIYVMKKQLKERFGEKYFLIKKDKTYKIIKAKENEETEDGQVLREG